MSQSLNLKIFHTDQLVEEKTLAQDVIKIGKLKSSHLCLEHEAVARMHAVIEVSGSDVRVIDLGSSTGTLLNGERVEKNAVLKDGDSLAFGPFRVDVAFSSAGAGASAESPGLASQVASGALAHASIAQPGGHPAGTAPAVTTSPMGPQVSAGPIGGNAAGARPILQVDASEVERQDGSTVTEVMTVYGRTVLDVQHVGQVKSRRASAPFFLAVGGVMLLGGAGFFASETVLRSAEWEAYDAQAAQRQLEGRTAPETPGTGLGGLGVLLAFAGLVPFGVGLARLSDKGVPNYTIGEGDEATFATPTAGLPNSAAFPLVRGGETGDATLNFTQEMTGDVTLDGQRISLAELVSSGRAAAMGSTYSFPIPAGAHCKLAHNGLVFHVNSVPPGRVLAQTSETDKPFWLYSAGSLVVLGSLLVLAHLALPNADGMSLDDDLSENRFVGYMNQPDELPEEEPPPEQDNASDQSGGSGQRHKGAEGKMGKPSSKKKTGLYAMKGPKDATPQMARDFDPDMMARNAGILGMIQQESGHFLASPYGAAFAVGNDDEDVWGGLTGTEVGEAFGAGGLGLVGTGRGGGGTGEGTIGLGGVGTIGKGGGGGSGSGYGRGSGAGFGGRGKRVPRVRQAKANVKGALDKDIIRRIVRAHINEVRYCYNQGLARDPNLKGRVAVQFTIGPTGKVPLAVVSQSSLKDQNVANCVAKAVRRWKFPKPPGGGNVVVTYPFVLEPG